MRYILSLIGNPVARTLGAEAVGEARAALAAAGAAEAPPVLLAPEIAADIPFDGIEPAAARAAVAHALEGLPLDINVLPAEQRRKKLLVADMESTIITCECLDELAAFVGLREKIAAITERAMRGEIAFEPALRERVALLKDLPETTLAQVARERVRFTNGAQTLVATMRAHGAYTVLVSGGFTYFAEPVAKAAGFDAIRANRLNLAGGKLTGTVAEPILGRDAKRAALRETAAARGLTSSDALAVGDGANDLAMIEEAGLGVAFHAKPAVAAAARCRIDHGDLTALLYLQGYAASEFASV